MFMHKNMAINFHNSKQLSGSFLCELAMAVKFNSQTFSINFIHSWNKTKQR